VRSAARRTGGPKPVAGHAWQQITGPRHSGFCHPAGDHRGQQVHAAGSVPRTRRAPQIPHLPLRLWGLLQDVTTGSGYRPGRAALWLTGLVAAGTIAFALHHPTPAKGNANAEFNPFFYTLDLLLPVLSYGQQSAYEPTGAYQWLSYALITAGWILATTIITGLTRALYRG
jgi:hypothetical protein